MQRGGVMRKRAPCRELMLGGVSCRWERIASLAFGCVEGGGLTERRDAGGMQQALSRQIVQRLGRGGITEGSLQDRRGDQ